MIGVLIAAVVIVAWIAVCLVVGSVMGGDTKLREREASHALAYEKRLAVLRGDAGIVPTDRSAS